MTALTDNMTFGTFMAPFHRVGENPTLALERDLELIEWLDDLGFDEAWIGEHHSGGWETIASPEVFIAAAAGRKLSNLPRFRCCSYVDSAGSGQVSWDEHPEAWLPTESVS